jgi:hypothetical protein
MNTSKTFHLARYGLGLLVVTALSACGSDDTPATDPVAITPPVEFFPGSETPLAATQTSAAAMIFVKEVVATPEPTAEAKDPLEMGDATLAVNETDEPDSDV